ncbi:MAG: GMC family oxidoreductase [Galactobacter sp.]
MDNVVEHLVIGAGSAGAVIARRLLDAGHRVTLVEAGQQDEVNPDIDHLPDAGKIWHSAQDWDYYSTPQTGASGRRLHLPKGKVMGGSHSLNACIWVRGESYDYDQWAQNGCPGWEWDQVLPYFKRIENFDGGASDVRGGDGLLDVRADFPRNPVQEDMVEAAVQAGFVLDEDYNDGHAEGVSRMQLNLRDGLRLSTWRAYLRPVQDHQNLTLITGGRVLKLIVEATGDDATPTVRGVVYRDADRNERELRSESTILCAGALGSPELLLRSGIGPAEELREVGVEPVADLGQVGKNLHDHFLSPVIYSTERPVPFPETAAAETHLFSRSSDDQPVCDLQPLFFNFPMYSQDYREDGGVMEGPDNGFTLHAGLVQPEGRGSVTLTGAGADDPIAVDVAALAGPTDAQRLAVSVRQMLEIGKQEALSSWGPTEIYPGPDVVTDDDLDQYVRDSVVTYHHQVGTCRMGTDVEAVVDPSTFAVRGVTGLRVADASIMPKIPAGNTNAPTIMIAERCADALIGAASQQAQA